MSAKLVLVLCVAVFSAAFGMPSAKPAEEEQKMEHNENMKTEETTYLKYLPSISVGYSSYPSLIRGGYGGYGVYPYGPRGYYDPLLPMSTYPLI